MPKSLALLNEISDVLLRRHQNVSEAIYEVLNRIQEHWPYEPVRFQITFDDQKFEIGPASLRNKMYSDVFINCFIDNNSSLDPRTRDLIEAISKKLELFFDYVRNEQRLNKVMNHKLAMLQEKQRREIASDLHDHLGQALAMMKIKLRTLRGNAIFCGLDNIMNELVTLTDQSINYTRTLTAELVPPALYELGLVPALEWLAESSKKKHRMEITFIGVNDLPKLSDEYNIIIFRAVSELIINVIKHASASKIEIKMEKTANTGFLIHIIDNGVGFDIQKNFKNIQKDQTRFGILSIKDRLAFNGGKLLLESELGKGTHATIEVKI